MEKKNLLAKDILLALIIGVGVGLAAMLAGFLFGFLREGVIRGLLWGRAFTLIAGGVAMVYGGLRMFQDEKGPGAASFLRFSPGKKKRTLADELQPRDDQKKIFCVLPHKHAALCIGVGILASSFVSEGLLALFL